ncbi:MAG: transposase [Deltaproteobacteria bacterium]|jgi:hypothetical protein|nr:transposase [Deltaproteobacteria bacterium]
MEREARTLQNAAIEAGQKRLGELVIEYEEALKAQDELIVLPEEWSKFHKNHFMEDWFAIFSKEVLEHLDTDAVIEMYPAKGKFGRPPKKPEVMCALLFVKTKFNLTYEETSVFLMSNGFFQASLHLALFSRETFVHPKTIENFEHMMEEKELTEAIFGVLDAAWVKKYGPDCRVARGDGFNLKSNMKKLNHLLLMFNAVRRALNEARKSDPKLYGLILPEIKERYHIDKDWVSVFALIHDDRDTKRLTAGAADDMFTLLQMQGKRGGRAVGLKTWRDLERVFGDQRETVLSRPARKGRSRCRGKKPGARLKPGS